MQDFGAGPGGSGMISGKWINKQTGASVFVRDAIMQGDEMIVITDRGQLTGEDFSRNYIQMSDEEYDMKGNVVSTGSQTTSKPSKQAASKPQPMPVQPIEQPRMFDIEDDPLMTVAHQPQNQKIELESESEKLIKKLFSKINSKPEISIDIKWADFPKQELSMLMNMFDVTKEDIASHLRTYLDNEAVDASIGRFLDKML